MFLKKSLLVRKYMHKIFVKFEKKYHLYRIDTVQNGHWNLNVTVIVMFGLKTTIESMYYLKLCLGLYFG